MHQNLPATVQATLAAWHRIVASRDSTGLPELLHPDALFRSPMAFKPYRSAEAVALVLSTVLNVFEDFAYAREFASADGLSLTLEFSARVGDKQLKGVDLVRFDSDGKIVEFEVMIRPINATAALGAEMGKRLGAALPAFKAEA